MLQELANMRKNYTKHSLSEKDVPADPLSLFSQWLSEANGICAERNAMALATVSSEGKPSVRMVLLKDFDVQGFVFYTDYRSRKALELDANSWASLVLWWEEMERQVRIEGQTSRVIRKESETYFMARPRGHQLAAWASHEDKVIPDREILEGRMTALEQTYKGWPIPCPETWGGYRVVPSLIEFWQGRPNRLHDRIQYRYLSHKNWSMERLSP
jgi:pyridoxamine 5'-phosphate oxidase